MTLDRDEGIALEDRDLPDRVRPAWPVRYPLLPAAILLATGIALHDQFPAAPGWMLLATGLTVGLALLCRTPLAGTAAVSIAFFCLGIAAAQVARFQFATDDLVRFTGEEPRLAHLRAKLLEPPRLLRIPDAPRPRPPKMATLAEATEVLTWTGWEPASGRMLLQFDTPVPGLKGGETVEIFGLLERPGAAMNPGQFDFAAYYRGRRILSSFSVDTPLNVEVIAPPSPDLLARSRQAVRRCLDAGFSARDQEQGRLLGMMMLGDRDPAMNDVWEIFRQSGTSHYLAVSGQHVAVVGGLVFGLLRLLGVGPRAATLIGAGVVVTYGLLAAPSPPVIRATILAGAFGLGLVAGRRGGGIQLLSLACIIILAVFPLDLFRAGFQLSFATVLGLIVFTKILLGKLGAAPETDAQTLRRQRDNLWVRLTHWIDRRMLMAVSAAVVAWLVAMPLVARHFGQFNPWAIPASLAASPFVLLSLVGGVFKVALTAAIPQGAWLWAWLAARPVEAMQATVAFFARQPGADVPLPVPSIPLLLVFYGSLLLWLIQVPAPAIRWGLRTPFFASCLLIFVYPLARIPGIEPERPLQVTLLAVGAGQAAVIETPTGRVSLIDAGSTSLGNPVDQAIAPMLRQRGHASVERIILSHANFDHYSGGAQLVRQYGVAEVLVGPRFIEDAGIYSSGRDLVGDLTDLDRPPREVRVGEVLPLGRQTRLRMLWPDPNRLENLSSNDASLVVLLEHETKAGTRRILFTGDIQEQGIAGLMATVLTDGAMEAEVLIAPHHGSREDNTAALIEAVNPTWIVSSNGRTLSQKQLSFAEIVAHREFLRTSDVGAVTIRIWPDGKIEVSGFLDDPVRPLGVTE